jgi:tetratricopeptide (TPR) repeat protein
MTASPANITEVAHAHGRKESVWLLALVLCGLIGAVAVARWTERYKSSISTIVPAEEQLYVKGAAAKRMSLAFNAIMADWYWMRSLQYIGRKAAQHEKIRLDNLSELDLKLLAPLLDSAATLDPEFMAVYEYGAVVLPTVSDTDEDEEAIALLRKGIAANPEAWRLYHHLGYIYWQRGDYKSASEAYGTGAGISGAPVWMKAMEANMLARGASPQLAREIYERMREQANDEQVKVFAEYRLAQLDSMDERAAIKQILYDYGARAGGRCPASWREIQAELRAARLRIDSAGAPVDPTNVPYVLIDGGCSVDLHPESKIPRR